MIKKQVIVLFIAATMLDITPPTYYRELVHAVTLTSFNLGRSPEKDHSPFSIAF